jgi:O-antigen/teichoic acid export membrane protein
MTSIFAGCLRRIANFAGIDQTVFFTLLTRGWSIGAGIITIFFVTKYLSAELQGYYYTFYSLIALQIFVELGLTMAIVQFSSHEMASLSWSDIDTVIGDNAAKRRLQSILLFALSWFGAAALVMIAVLLPIGKYFFQVTYQGNFPSLDVSLPWSMLVIGAALNLLVTASVAILEGCGRVKDVSKLRLSQSVITAVVVWLILALDGELFALVGSSVAMAVTGMVWIYFKYCTFFKDLLAESKNLPGINWRREIWPFQWRIGISWMSGYLLFQLFNPLLLATHGPIVAGKMGMSMQIFSALNGAAMAWISTKTPLYGQLIARQRRQELDHLFFRALTQSFALLLLGIAVSGLVIYYLSKIDSSYHTRLLEPHLLFVLALASLGNHIVFAEASYLRAHKEEPFMLLSVLNGIFTATLSLLLIPVYGAAGAVGAYVTTTLTIGLGYGTIVFNRKRRLWNANFSARKPARITDDHSS